MNDTTNSTAPPSSDASRITDQVRDGYHAIEEQLSVIQEGADELRARANQLNERAIVLIQDHPGMAILGAFGIGYLLGTLAARRWIV